MKKCWLYLMLVLFCISVGFSQSITEFQSSTLPANAVWLDSLDVSKAMQGWGIPHANKSLERKPLTVGGHVFSHGVGTHALGKMIIKLNESATQFASYVGLDDETQKIGSVQFQVWVDGKKTAESKVFRLGDAPEFISADLTGAKELMLIVEDGGDGIGYDHADWLGARIYLQTNAKKLPVAVDIPGNPVPVLAKSSSPKPAIHGARIVGSTPGRPFLFRIPATGKEPLAYSASNLPAGMVLNPQTGIITGSLQADGTTKVLLTVTNSLGKASRELTIVGGQHKLALTPPMGWNSWNVWGTSVSAEKVKVAADWMVESGLAAHGFTNINIDDAWEAGRGSNGEILTNEKFPDMKALADYVHSKGLKIGIYSSPGPKTCGGYEGSFQHEFQDAQTYANWGIDYLKYDWCSYHSKDHSFPELQKPYILMRQALDSCNRDIVYSLCQYGMGSVWVWGADVGGNLWRTTGDIQDVWDSMATIGFQQAPLAPYAQPGHWNDPDMLVVGKVGWGPTLRDCLMTKHEQITHITLWSMLAAPLLIGCDLSQMDEFTLQLLTNDEVLDVNQDPLGKQATRAIQNSNIEVWSKPLWDGGTAIAIFNKGKFPEYVTIQWKDLRLSKSQKVRDLWQNKNMGRYNHSFTTPVPIHGAVLIKVSN